MTFRSWQQKEKMISQDFVINFNLSIVEYCKILFPIFDSEIYAQIEVKKEHFKN